MVTEFRRVLFRSGNYTGSVEVRFQVVERFFAEWSRLWGDDALGTMSAVSRAGFAASDAVVVASAEGYWDALSASPLAGALGAPVLLTASGSLSPEAAAEAARLGASKAYVVGGPVSVSPAVVDALAAAGLKVERVAGDDAPGTAAAVAATLGAGSSSTCVVATSATYQDALSAGPYAYAERSPIFLTGPDGSLSEATLAAVAASGCSRAIVAGGEMSVPAGARAALEEAGLSVVSWIYFPRTGRSPP